MGDLLTADVSTGRSSFERHCCLSDPLAGIRRIGTAAFGRGCVSGRRPLPLAEGKKTDWAEGKKADCQPHTRVANLKSRNFCGLILGAPDL